MSTGRRRFTIYLVTCVPTRQAYVGVTHRTPEIRLKQLIHEAMAPRASAKRDSLAAAIRKYGPSSFIVRPLQVCYSRDRAHELECFHIRKQGTLRPNGFNGNAGGPVGLEVRVMVDIKPPRASTMRGAAPRVFSEPSVATRSISRRSCDAVRTVRARTRSPPSS